MANLQPENSVFQAELLVKHEAIIWAMEQNELFNVWSDSMARLLAIKSLKTTNKTAKAIQTLLSQNPNITINWIISHNGCLGNEKSDQLAKRATIQGTAFNLQKTIAFLKKTLTQLSMESWQREWEEIATSRHTFDVLPKVALISRQWSRKKILFVTGHGPFPSTGSNCVYGRSDVGELGSPRKLEKAGSGIGVTGYVFCGAFVNDLPKWNGVECNHAIGMEWSGREGLA
ncbi:hypothetical protein AVEN_118014-1 [Araneus ventricosus]|uniref:RNase H type-1 domain-containing protein n=1 Tax=Araneus ventricosus TaxID=182803 RepID=A0A4Y2C8I6_ARAVE|nr:hypothetical protein AVEN_118014-1 [Araneus ventricosus]